MGRVAPVYPTSAKGEISPLVIGRIDTQQYYAGLDKCRNCVIRPYGLSMRRAGTQYLTETKDSTKQSRLIKFVFSNADAYMIEVGAGYFRFYNNKAQVVKTLSDTDAWLTATAYVVGDFVQESSTIYYCIEDHTSGTFATDLTADKWIAQDIYEVPNTYTEDQLSGIQFEQIDDIIKLTAPVTDTSTDTHPKDLVRFGANNWTFGNTDFKSTPYLDENITTTTIASSGTTGSVTLTASTGIFESGHVGSFWQIGGTTGTPTLQGYVKITAFTSATQVTADVIQTLSSGAATTEWSEGAFSDVQGYPSVVALHAGRLYYARTPSQPRNIFGSKPFSYETFTPAVDNEDDGAINVELAAGDSNDIKWLASGSDLVGGTYGGDFIIKSSTGVITPTTISATRRTSWGSEAIQPQTIGSFIYYVQRGGRKLRELFFYWDLDTYKSVDMSTLSEHITDTGIIDIAYAQSPDSIIWGIRADGKVTTFTRESDQEVMAWALQGTDGLFESVETIPSLSEPHDEVWFIVKRTINGVTKRYIEFIDEPTTPDIQQDCHYVDAGASYSSYDITSGISLTLSDTTGVITATAGSSVFTADSVNKRIRVIDEDANILGQAKITAYTSGTEVTATVISEFSSSTYTGGNWGVSVSTISGLDYIEGKEVSILADGAVQTPRTVASGEITLELDAWKVAIGLQYLSYMVTLPLEAGSQNGTAIGKRKRINELSLRVWRTLGVKVGKDLSNLQKIQFRNPITPMGEPEAMFTGVIPNIKYNQGWTWDANMTIAQEDPLPMNILVIAPIVTEVDK